MTVREARYAINGPLVFGDARQIEAAELLERYGALLKDSFRCFGCNGCGTTECSCCHCEGHICRDCDGEKIVLGVSLFREWMDRKRLEEVAAQWENPAEEREKLGGEVQP